MESITDTPKMLKGYKEWKTGKERKERESGLGKRCAGQKKRTSQPGSASLHARDCPVHQIVNARWKQKAWSNEPNLENLAGTLLRLFPPARMAFAVGVAGVSALLVDANGGVDSKLKDLVYPPPLLAAALDICGAHSLGHRLALFRRHRRQALSFQELNAGSLGPQIRLQPNQDDGSGGTEMEHFRVPLHTHSVSEDP
jgi:hypothetical protein